MINAAHVSGWAATAEAQRTLPKLVRRLVNLTATTTQIAVPSGESTSQPGWDGEVHSPDGNAWVPAGHSCWEVSCEADVMAKANRDYRKRTADYPKEYRGSRSFVFVTPRKWMSKTRWVEERRAESDWLDVRAYDADDLEQWLEHSPGLALAFAEELGLTGSGVESLKAFLGKWSAQTQPAITADALLVGRDEQAEQFLKTVEEVATDAPPQPRSVKADSVEEAVAFVAAALRRRQELADAAVVVTHADGWRFVDKNIQIRVAIAASPEIAAHPAVRNGLVVVVPYASGDMTKQFEGVAGRLDGDELHLERPHHHKFEEALHQIGLEQNDAQRLSVQCGRSWSVFRRQHATNPAVRRPAWLDHPSAPALSTLCLLGSWSSGKPADKEFVERLCGRRYSELEADLLELERLDDSPILHIGEVWKAKSALELLALFGDRITDEQYERFFTACAALLGEPDPQLELPDEERYAAAIHGKVRPVSGLLMNAICDTLIKLAVRGAEIPALAARDTPLKIDALVRNLLQGADATRWMSLSSHLPELAEASPEVFLRAVESSLAAADRPVTHLLSESKTGGMGRCWHAGLLWALETLAWAPQRLTRVSLILAKLAETEIAGNWGNTPLGTLVDLYRSWFPQTSASLRQRIAALDVLAERAPDVAALLLDKLVGIRHDTASPTARPKWRDDDAGAGRGVTNKEHHEMLVAALERQIALGQGNAVRLSALVRKLGDFDPPRVERVLEQLRELEDATDEDKEILRSALRELIHWHRNFGDQGSKLDTFLAPIEASYERLSPNDPVIRHAWLVSSSWPDPPFRTRDDDFGDRQGQIAQLRNAALADIFAERGWNGLEELALHAAAGRSVGLGVPSLALGDDVAATWIVDRCGALPAEDQLTAMAAGILGANDVTERDRLLDVIFEKADERALPVGWKIRLLTLCSDGPLIWKRAAALGPDAETLYWQTCTGRFWLGDASDDLNFAIGKLLEVKRAASAFDNLHGKFATLDPDHLMGILEAINESASNDLNRIDAYWIREALVHLEKSVAIDVGRLARLEFAMFPVFGYEGEQQAASLYDEVMGKPGTFMELLCLVFRAEGEEQREADEVSKGAATTAWRVLHACRRQPAMDRDGHVEPAAFAAFTSETRALATQKGRLTVCDLTLGEILAYAPEGADGVWPFEPARDVLECVEGDELLRGFRTGCFNKRGVHSRGVFDGGTQERELANDYRRHASALEITHPSLAAALHELAKSYDRDGLLEDLEARLRREGR